MAAHDDRDEAEDAAYSRAQQEEWDREAEPQHPGEVNHEPLTADDLTRLVTAFPDFESLICAPASYVPTLRADEPDAARLADLYDAAMAERASPKRAWRGTP